MSPQCFESVYPPRLRHEAQTFLRIPPGCVSQEQLAESPQLLGEVELILSCWGMPRVDEAFLAAAPRLRLICYAAGSVRHFVTDAMWDRGIRVTHAAGQNAQPVAEFTFAHVILALKRSLPIMRECRARRVFRQDATIKGAYGTTVGVVSLGLIGRLVVERLATLGVRTLVYDIHSNPAWATKHGATYVSLEELFSNSDVVSIHTPLLDETRGMVGEALLRSMKPGATLINTARGAIIDEPALVRVLTERQDLSAILDVTHPEPPASDSALWTLDNAFLFPHIAGAIGGEHARLGEAMVAEARRYLAGEPLLHEVMRESMAVMA